MPSTCLRLRGNIWDLKLGMVQYQLARLGKDTRLCGFAYSLIRPANSAFSLSILSSHVDRSPGKRFVFLAMHRARPSTTWKGLESLVRNGPRNCLENTDTQLAKLESLHSITTNTEETKAHRHTFLSVASMRSQDDSLIIRL